MIAPIIRMDRIIIVIALITLNFGRVETAGFCREALRFFCFRFVDKIGVRENSNSTTCLSNNRIIKRDCYANWGGCQIANEIP